MADKGHCIAVKIYAYPMKISIKNWKTICK